MCALTSYNQQPYVYMCINIRKYITKTKQPVTNATINNNEFNKFEQMVLVKLLLRYASAKANTIPHSNGLHQVIHTNIHMYIHTNILAYKKITTKYAQPKPSVPIAKSYCQGRFGKSKLFGFQKLTIRQQKRKQKIKLEYKKKAKSCMLFLCATYAPTHLLA